MTTPKTIGVLTSGGDCAGLNAVIRAVVARAVKGYGWRVFGIHQGTRGLLSRPVDAVQLDLDSAGAAMLRLAGTILGSTNRGDPFAYPLPDGGRQDRSEEVIEGIRLLGLEALIGIGGDGSLAILRRLAQQGGIPLVGIPKTIDNDVGGTESSVGFHTAVMVATEAIDRLQPTAASHDRVMILEVMGRDCGQIALAAGIAGGADVILVPEIPYSIDVVAAHISKLRHGTHNFAIVVVAEGVRNDSGAHVERRQALGNVTYGGIGHVLGETIAQMTGAETRVTVLGHVQRGGQPTWDDRLIASAFGIQAVDLIAEGRYDRLVAWRNRRVLDIPLLAAFEPAQRMASDDTLLRTARGLDICLGDKTGVVRPISFGSVLFRPSWPDSQSRRRRPPNPVQSRHARVPNPVIAGAPNPVMAAFPIPSNLVMAALDPAIPTRIELAKDAIPLNRNPIGMVASVPVVTTVDSTCSTSTVETVGTSFICYNLTPGTVGVPRQ